MVSIVIPTYGRPEKLKEAVSCALGQTYKELEVIVVDDNGEGTEAQRNTQVVLSEIRDDRLKYYVHKRNKGGCAARNTGIKKSYGQYIAFLDDDDVWKKSYIARQLKVLQQPNVSAVYCDYFLYDGRYTYVENHSTVYEGMVFDKLLRGWCPVSTSLVMVKKKDIIEAGMFDESLKSFQDYDMWLRLSKVGEFRYCNERLMIKYMFVGEQLSVNPAKREAGYNRICEKWESSIQENDRKSFEMFKKSYGESVKYNRIQYYILNDKNKYKNEILNYIKNSNNKKYRYKAIKNYVLPSKINDFLKKIVIFLDPGKSIIKGIPKGFNDD